MFCTLANSIASTMLSETFWGKGLLRRPRLKLLNNAYELESNKLWYIYPSPRKRIKGQRKIRWLWGSEWVDLLLFNVNRLTTNSLFRDWYQVLIVGTLSTYHY